MKVIEFKKNKKIPLADKDSKLCEKQNVCHICRKKLKIKILTTKNIVKLRITVFVSRNTEVLYIRYVIQDIIYLKKFEI